MHHIYSIGIVTPRVLLRSSLDTAGSAGAQASGRVGADDRLEVAMELPPHAHLDEAELDAVLADSFPASDPPPWTLGVPR